MLTQPDEAVNCVAGTARASAVSAAYLQSIPPPLAVGTPPPLGLTSTVTSSVEGCSWRVSQAQHTACDSLTSTMR